MPAKVNPFNYDTGLQTPKTPYCTCHGRSHIHIVMAVDIHIVMAVDGPKEFANPLT